MYYYNNQGTSAGPKEHEAMNLLEKHYKKKDGNFSTEETIETVIDTLQTVLIFFTHKLILKGYLF